jgi:glycosyltransferase involved in cell wall biosynthesis
MANQMNAVMQNDALRDTLWSNAYAEYEQMSWDATSERITHIYEEHVAGVPA